MYRTGELVVIHPPQSLVQGPERVGLVTMDQNDDNPRGVIRVALLSFDMESATEADVLVEAHESPLDLPFLLPTLDEIPVSLEWVTRSLGPIGHRAYHHYTVAYCARRIPEYAPVLLIMREASGGALTGPALRGPTDPRRVRLEREAAERERLGRAAMARLFGTDVATEPGHQGGALTAPAMEPDAR